mgnify:CR=1 FL=1
MDLLDIDLNTEGVLLLSHVIMCTFHIMGTNPKSRLIGGQHCVTSKKNRVAINLHVLMSLSNG